MKFDELDARMRIFETARDYSVLPGIHTVARIDGRGFTRLTKEVHEFEAPFDVRFRNMMVETVKHLMDCGFRTLYGYTQSDEISLLFHRDVDAFDRKTRKYNSILAGEASAKFSLLLGAHAVFDCRISELPAEDNVVDYFRWRSEDAHRNALNSHCYWVLRREGKSAGQSASSLHCLSVAEKNELLFQRGINFNDLPQWQRRGVGVLWETYEKQGLNPLTGQESATERRRLHVNLELPIKEDYSLFIKGLLGSDRGMVDSEVA